MARLRIDLQQYRDSLRARQSRGYSVMSTIYAKAKASKKSRIVFPEGEHRKILQAAQILRTEGICEPVLVGDAEKIRAAIEEQKLEDLGDVRVVDMAQVDIERYAAALFDVRQRRGLTMQKAREEVTRPNTLATLMLSLGEVEGMVTGLTMSYPEAIRAPLQIIKTRNGKRAGGVYLLVFKNDFKFLADCTVNVQPSAEELAEIALQTADLARSFDIKPRVAMLSYSNFGSAQGESPERVQPSTSPRQSPSPRS